MALPSSSPAVPDLGVTAGSPSGGNFTQGSALPNITTTQSQATAAPTFYTDYLNQIAQQGGQAAQNAQYIGATDLQNQAFQNTANNVGNYQPAMNLANQNLQQAGNYNAYSAGSGIVDQALQNNAVGNANPYLQTGANMSGLGAANPYLQAASNPTYNQVQGYMNPYIQSVVNAAGDIGEQNIRRNLAPQATAGLVGSGQFGSSRGAAALGDTIANAELGLSGQQASLLSSGYQNAAQQAMAQNQLNAQLGSTAGQLTNQQAQNMLQAGSTLGQLTNQQMQNQLTAGQLKGALAGQTQTGLLNQGAQAQQLAGQTQALGLGDINALATLGGQQQTIAQNQQLFPMQQLTNESQLLRGYTMPTSTSSSYTGPIPGAYAASPLQQIAGLGALGAGISNTELGKTLFGTADTIDPKTGAVIKGTSSFLGKGLGSLINGTKDAYDYVFGARPTPRAPVYDASPEKDVINLPPELDPGAYEPPP
jgi:hypothetical protein